MAYMLTAGCMVLAACICIISYIVIDKRLQEAEKISESSDVTGIGNESMSDFDVISESGITVQEDTLRKINLYGFLKKIFPVSNISCRIVFFVAVILVGICCYCAQVMHWNGSGINTIGIIKIIIASEILMSAAVIDFYIKKIPNTLSIVFLVAGAILLVIEYFCMRDSFLILLLGSLLGFIGGFLILILMSIVTRGGIGMGDVKLISTMGFVTGIAASFYTFLFANILCMLVTIGLLITKKKKIKDELPFGPFLFIGYIVVVILGKF